MARAWVALMDAIDRAVTFGLFLLLALGAAVILGALLYFYPRWIPRRWPRLRMPSVRKPRWWSWPTWRSWRPWRRRRRRPTTKAAPVEPVTSGAEELPDLPVAAFLSLADQLAAQGRFAEAVRERLRAIVRDLVDLRVIEHQPGWTVTELARAAGSARPRIATPLTTASDIFSDIWYGQRPATADDDGRMRTLTDEVHAGAIAPAEAVR